MMRLHIQNAYDQLELSRDDKDRMLQAILSRQEVARRPALPRSRKLLLAAAVLSIMLALVGCTAVILTLNQRTVGQEAFVPWWEKNPTAPPVLQDVITLAGIVGSNSYQASKEWYDFSSAYNPDLNKIGAAEAAGFQPPQEYEAYFAYTQELVDQVDLLCQKYGLQLLGPMICTEDEQEVFEALSIPGILKEGTHSHLSIYGCYPGGTFSLDGRTELDGQTIFFQYGFDRKDVLCPDHMLIGQLSDYDQWNYETTDGNRLLLALSPHKGLIILDREDGCFWVNVLGLQTEETAFGALPQNRSFLEALAETFDFTIRPQPVADPDIWYAKMETRLQEAIDDQNPTPTRPISNSYDDYVRYYFDHEHDKNAFFNLDNMTYTLYDINGDGTEELLLGNGSAFPGNENGFYRVVGMVNGEAAVLMDQGTVFSLYEDNVFGRSNTDENGKTWYFYFQFQADQVVDALDGLSEEAILDYAQAHTHPIALQMTPLRQYPFSD